MIWYINILFEEIRVILKDSNKNEFILCFPCKVGGLKRCIKKEKEKEGRLEV